MSEYQKKCFILADEVYVKPGNQYSGGIIYGKAENNPTENANTVLALMVVCLFGGPKFVAKYFPVVNLEHGFQVSVIDELVSLIEEAGGCTEGLIFDNNKVNQKTKADICGGHNFAKIKSDGTLFYVFNDTVHIVKCIRNNWLTEKTQILSYRLPNDYNLRFARWEFLISLVDAYLSVFFSVSLSFVSLNF